MGGVGNDKFDGGAAHLLGKAFFVHWQRIAIGAPKRSGVVASRVSLAVGLLGGLVARVCLDNTVFHIWTT